MPRAVLVAVALATLTAAGAATASQHCVASQLPRLTILSPRSGETVRAPFKVRYSVAGFRIGAAPYGHIRVYVDRVGGLRFDLAARGQSGETAVPDHPLLSGRRDLVFVLVRANGTRVPGAKATFTLRDVVIEGRRGAR